MGAAESVKDNDVELHARSCGNCNAALSDRYCANCGQDSHVTLTVRHFLEECVEGLTHFDSTFWRTFLPLLFRPGHITDQYLGGKRRFFAPPVRTYLVLSIVYFILSSLATSMSIGPHGEYVGPQDCSEFAKGMSWLQGLVPDLEQSCLRSRRDGGEALVSALGGMLPKVMFVVLPLVALVQYWIYHRQRPLYVENLIFVLHFQSFFYLAGSLLLLVALLATAIFRPAGEAIAGALEFILFAWATVYLFVANRRVYRAGRLKTVMAMLALAFAYMIFWVLGVSVAALYAVIRA